MIPKIIHYCWFGGKALPQSVQKCIESWKQFCPSYEFIEWNESNFDVNYNDFTREAYEAKNYAFVSDVARLFALCNLGGCTWIQTSKLSNRLMFFCNIRVLLVFSRKTTSFPPDFWLVRKDLHCLRIFFLLIMSSILNNPTGNIV